MSHSPLVIEEAMELHRLAAMEAFVRVVETGSFSGTARQLGVGQPAVSKWIAELEEQLGVRLVRRSTKCLTPTEAGQQFYERARRAIDEADEAMLVTRGTGAGLSGRLRVSAAVTFARLSIVPRLSSFMAQHPELELELVLDDRTVDLVEEGIDVALRMGSVADPTATARRIGRLRRMVVGTPAYFAEVGVPTAPDDLPDHRAVIHVQQGGGADWTFHNDYGAEAPIRLRGRLRVTATEGVREAVLADIGLCVTSEAVFGPELRRGIVRSVLPDWHLPPVDLWAVFPTGRLAGAKARAFVAFVEDLVRNEL